MIDTQESDLAPAVAATIGPLHTTRRGLVHSGMFAEIKTGDIVSWSGYFRSHTAPRTLSRAEREAISFSTRSTAAPKKWDNTSGNMSGICDENIALTGVRRTAVCDKNFDYSANLMRPISARNSVQPPRLVGQRQAAVMTRSSER